MYCDCGTRAQVCDLTENGCYLATFVFSNKQYKKIYNTKQEKTVVNAIIIKIILKQTVN